MNNIRNNHFSEISLLITHYNRSQSLGRLLKKVEELEISFNEIIVSDDNSKPEHQNKLNEFVGRFGITLIKTPLNKGLANNLNKGQKAVKSPFTLYIQEDFVPTEKFLQALKDGFDLLKEDPSTDLVRFYAYRKYPFLKPIRSGFSEMTFRFWYPNAYQFNCYSDHPHLRRSNFLEKFGNYKEGIKSDKSEFRMVISFLQNKGKALIINDIKGILIQMNDVTEPSQVKRKKLRSIIQRSETFSLVALRFIYQNIKFRLQYFFQINEQ